MMYRIFYNLAINYPLPRHQLSCNLFLKRVALPVYCLFHRLFSWKSVHSFYRRNLTRSGNTFLRQINQNPLRETFHQNCRYPRTLVEHDWEMAMLQRVYWCHICLIPRHRSSTHWSRVQHWLRNLKPLRWQGKLWRCSVRCAKEFISVQIRILHQQVRNCY